MSNRSRHSLKKNKHERIALIALQKVQQWANRNRYSRFARQANSSQKNSYFSFVFPCFSPFLCPRANRSCRSLLRRSFLKRNRNNSLLLLFTIEGLWANFSRYSLQKSDRVSDLLLSLFCKSESLFRSFTHKNKRFAGKTKERSLNPDKCAVYVPVSKKLR